MGKRIVVILEEIIGKTYTIGSWVRMNADDAEALERTGVVRFLTKEERKGVVTAYVAEAARIFGRVSEVD